MSITNEQAMEWAERFQKWEHRKGGPGNFNPDVAEYILEELARGRRLSHICREPGMPGQSVVWIWARHNVFGFGQALKAAIQLHTLALADEILDIADDSRNDWMDQQTARGTVRVLDHEHVRRSAMRIETRKWIMGKFNAELFGEKVQLTGNGGGPVRVENVTETATVITNPIDAAREYSKLMGTSAEHVPAEPLQIEHEPTIADELVMSSDE